MQKIWLFVFVLFLTVKGFTQISPGELTKAHANLEGIGNCVKCHILGKNISSAKCLECHKEINELIKNKKGYHSSSEVTGKECFDCHNEHHGRNFEIIRFKDDNYDHRLTGYELLGKHKEVKCSNCHKTEFVKEKTSQKTSGHSFLGLKTDCLSCHADNHKGLLGTDCKKCHNFDSFKSIQGFDHQITNFPLVGKHATTECIKCHVKEVRNGETVQKFKGIKSSSCTDCHKDVHKGKFGDNCLQCHNQESFRTIKNLDHFDHNKTNFPLLGLHQKVNCKDCHKQNYTVHFKHDMCSDCHSDYHNGQFKKADKLTDCNECHNVDGFSPSLFTIENHKQANFQLEGKHLNTKCSDCHKKGDRWEFRDIGINCYECHTDYHNGQLKKEDKASNCSECHTVESFSPSSFNIEMHNQTKFNLSGGHLATPCFACHQKDTRWEFRKIGSKCADCHEDIHKNSLNETFYPEKRCENCHSVTFWQEIKFDHNQTEFKLEGKHRVQSCRKCHFEEKSDGAFVQKFTSLNDMCVNCHVDIHNGQFVDFYQNECLKCHNFENWEAERFNHDSTRFKLDGGHKDVACAKCHTKIQEGNVTYIKYKYTDIKCATCHSQ